MVGGGGLLGGELQQKEKKAFFSEEKKQKTFRLAVADTLAACAVGRRYFLQQF
jgi:hypothetical protein